MSEQDKTELPLHELVGGLQVFAFSDPAYVDELASSIQSRLTISPDGNAHAQGIPASYVVILPDSETLSPEEILNVAIAEMVRIVDGGRESEQVVFEMETRIDSIGRTTDHDKPLPKLRARLIECEHAYRKVIASHKELSRINGKRFELRRRLELLRHEQNDVALQQETAEHAEGATLLAQLDQIGERIQAITQQCFSVSAGRDFPVDDEFTVRKLDMHLLDTRKRRIRLDAEHASLMKSVDVEQARQAAGSDSLTAELDPSWERTLSDLEGRLGELRLELEQAEALHARLESELHQAEDELSTYPDFSRVAPNPLEWLNQLVASFSLAVRRRDEAREKRNVLQEEVRLQGNRILRANDVFEEKPNFAREMQQSQSEVNHLETQMTSFRNEREQISLDVEEGEDALPGFRTMSLLCAVGSVGCLLAARHTNVLGVYIPAALFGVALLYFLFALFVGLGKVRRSRQRMDAIEQAIETASRKAIERQQSLDNLLEEAGCESIRELEALYDYYVSESRRFAELSHDHAEYRRSAQAEEEFVTCLFDDLEKKFGEMGEQFTDELDVARAADRVAARFQGYRDAKRRVYDGRSRVADHRLILEHARRQYNACLNEELSASLQMRDLLRKADFPDEAKFTSALSALRAYRTRRAQHRHRSSRLDTLRQRLASVEDELAQARRQETEHSKSLEELLAKANVNSPDEWLQRCGMAKRYNDLWQTRAELTHRYETLAAGANIEHLRRKVEKADDGSVRSIRGGAAELRDRHDSLATEIESLEKEDKSLEIQADNLLDGAPDLAELEEEIAVLRRKISTLEWELRAAVHAATTVEESSRFVRGRLLPRIVSTANHYLKHLLPTTELELALVKASPVSVEPSRRPDKQEACAVFLALHMAANSEVCEENNVVFFLDTSAPGAVSMLGDLLPSLAQLGEAQQWVLLTSNEGALRVAEKATIPLIRVK